MKIEKMPPEKIFFNILFLNLEGNKYLKAANKLHKQ